MVTSRSAQETPTYAALSSLISLTTYGYLNQNELKLKIQFLSLTKRSSILESSFGQWGTNRWRVYSNAHVAVGWENKWGLKQQLGMRASELGIILFNMTSFYPWWKLGKFTVCTKKAQHIALNTKAFTNINPLLLKICVSALLISNTAVSLLPERSSYHPH